MKKPGTKMSTADFSSKVISREWLHEYKSLPPTEVDTYGSTIRTDDELTNSLFQLFEDEELDLPQEVVTPVCHQLFEYYRSEQHELQHFTLELGPVLILNYLAGVANNDKNKGSGIEACLLGIYNLENSDKDGNSKICRFTIPSLACPSIYHELPSLATLALTDNTLQCYHSNEHVVNIAPRPKVENTNAQNRLQVLACVMSCYNRDVAKLSSRSHQMLCKMCIRLCRMGFEQGSEGGTESDQNVPFAFTSSRGSQHHTACFQVKRRIPLSSEFLVEVLSSIYFVMFNGHTELGTAALEAVHQRAMYEMWPDVLLVTNTIKNSLTSNPSGRPMDGPMGISIALSPTTSNPSTSRHTITNASFRAKKIPDDIDVPDSPENETASLMYDGTFEQDQLPVNRISDRQSSTPTKDGSL